MSKATQGLTMIYTGQTQHGAGFFDTIKKGVAFAKKHKLATRAGQLADVTGTRSLLDKHSKGAFSAAQKKGKQHGFGKKKAVKKKGKGKK